MSEKYPHLHPTVRVLAGEDKEARIRRIRTDRWIGYARAEVSLAAYEELRPVDRHSDRLERTPSIAFPGAIPYPAPRIFRG